MFFIAFVSRNLLERGTPFCYGNVRHQSHSSRNPAAGLEADPGASGYNTPQSPPHLADRDGVPMLAQLSGFP